MTDVNERVRREWKEATASRERVKEILEETTEYTKASTIASRALVSEPTARKYLNELVEEGVGVTRQDGRTRRYKRDEGRVVDDRIEELRTEHTHAELVDGIREMKAEVNRYRERHGVDTPEDLAIELEADDEGWSDVGKWQATRRNLALAKAALQVDEAHRVAEA